MMSGLVVPCKLLQRILEIDLFCNVMQIYYSLHSEENIASPIFYGEF